MFPGNKKSLKCNEVKLFDYLLSVFIFFIFIFGPVLNKIGAWADFIFIFSFLVFIININKLKQFNKPPYRSFYVLIFLYLILSFRVLFYPDLTIEIFLLNFIKPFRVLFTLFTGYFIANYFYSKNFTFLHIIKIIYLCIVLNSVIINIQFFNIEFRDFIYGYTTTGEFRSTFEYDFRMGGLTGGSGGAILSTVQSLGIIFTPFLLMITYGFFSRLYIFIGTILLLLSIILTGRSGIYSIILFLPLTLYYIHGLAKSTLLIFNISVISVVIFLFINQLLVSLDYTDFYYSFSRTFDSFISLSETGNYENNTVEILKDHILFPEPLTLIFGNNEAMLNYDVGRNLDSDIGYVRSLYSYGLFGFILFLIPLVQLVYYTRIKIKNSMPHKLLFILLVIMAFFHFKESYLYVRMFWSIICLIIGFIVVENNNLNSKNTCVEL